MGSLYHMRERGIPKALVYFYLCCPLQTWSLSKNSMDHSAETLPSWWHLAHRETISIVQAWSSTVHIALLNSRILWCQATASFQWKSTLTFPINKGMSFFFFSFWVVLCTSDMYLWEKSSFGKDFEGFSLSAKNGRVVGFLVEKF